MGRAGGGGGGGMEGGKRETIPNATLSPLECRFCRKINIDVKTADPYISINV